MRNWLALLLLTISAGALAERHAIVIVDTSGSMNSNDPERYALHAARILRHMLEPVDHFALLRMPNGNGTSVDKKRLIWESGRGGQSLSPSLDSAANNSSTWLASPVVTANALFNEKKAKDRLLLVLSDDHLGDSTSKRTLGGMRRDNVLAAGVMLGGTPIRSSILGDSRYFKISRSARSANELVPVFAEIYQQFIGSKRMQQGDVRSGSLSFDIDPFVSEATLIAVDQAPIQLQLDSSSNHGGIDQSRHGQTKGRNVTSYYRIVKIKKPETGRWRFKAPGSQAKWVLVQESLVGIKYLDPKETVIKQDTTVRVQLINEVTNQPIKDVALLPNLSVTIDSGSGPVKMYDDGTNGDETAGDGILTGKLRFAASGKRPLKIKMESDLVAKEANASIVVVPARWRVENQTAKSVVADQSLTVEVKLAAQGPRRALQPPAKFEVRDARGRVLMELKPVGNDVYRGQWTPTVVGNRELNFHALGGTAIRPVKHEVNVKGYLKFPEASLNLGTHKSHSEKETVLDLSETNVKGEFSVDVATNLDAGRTSVEVEIDGEWQTIDPDEPLTLVVKEGAANQFKVRLRTGRCPCPDENATPKLTLTTNTAAGRKTLDVPVQVEFIEEHWFYCWWEYIVGTILMLLTAFTVYGIVTPAAFNRRIGIRSGEEDNEQETNFVALRAVRGSRSGFYRDARLYLSSDHRLSSSKQDAIVKFTAGRNKVLIEPLVPVLMQAADRTWQPLKEGAQRAYPGTWFKNEAETIYFFLCTG